MLLPRDHFVRPPRGAALPSARSPRGLAALAAAAAFALLAVGVARGWVWLGQFDREGAEQLGVTPGSAPSWGARVLAWTAFGPAVAAAGLLVLLTRVRRLRAARLVALVSAGRLSARWLIPLALGTALAVGVSELMVRLGPHARAAFPSVAALSVALLVGLVWALWPRSWTRLAGVAWGLAACLALVVLGVRWPSDVLGGALLGTALVAGGPLGRGTAWARRAGRRR